MSIKNYILDKTPTIAVLTSLLFVSACGTYQQAGSDADGIYNTSTTAVEQETNTAVDNSVYYQNYFKEKTSEYAVYTNDEVFTDVDEYSGEYVENDSIQYQPQAYAGWGQETSNVSINVYNGGGFYNNFYDPFYFGYYPPIWTNHYFYRPYYYTGYYNPWWHGGYYGGFYGGYYHNPWNNYYYGNHVAFINGRRGGAYNMPGRYGSSRYFDSNRIYNAAPRRDYTRSSHVGRRDRTQTDARATRSTRSTVRDVRSTRNNSNNVAPNSTPRVRNNSTPRVRNNNTPRVQTNSTPRPRVRTNSTPRTNSNFSTPRRSSSPTIRSGGSSRGSSGGMRSSGGRRGGM
ncbi:hypothetical protein ACFSQP_00245 [Bizionia sediminis]|uniref:Vitellogenin II n=1 Tax=Bizionia sediminis TaxID=1737064 RepID=A0ABW5KNP2_9FLAO